MQYFKTRSNLYIYAQPFNKVLIYIINSCLEKKNTLKQQCFIKCVACLLIPPNKYVNIHKQDTCMERGNMEQISYHWRKICLFDYKWALNGVPWSAKHWRNPNAFSIFVQSLFRIVFAAFVSLLSTFLIKSMYSGVNTRKQVNRCQGRLPAEVTSLLLNAGPTISFCHASFLPL